mmetsp:Transcript_27919/g.20913  ORF Transcript_27919/g.20913 Transcript_27919/m.20913 type:complete len:261 (-) Transcript_27919:88-870(-)
MLTLRVRTQVGTYRLNEVSPMDTFEHIKGRLLSEHKANVVGNISLEAKSSKSTSVADSMTVQEAGLSNGHMLHAEVSSDTTMTTSSSSSASGAGGSRLTTIGKDGSIIVSEVTNTWAASLFGANLTSKKGSVNTTSALQGKKRIGLYFSAHWCPPCRQFTPLLAEFYETIQQENASDLEIIFVSSDRDGESFNEYFSEMPWLSIPFSERGVAASLGTKFGIRGIPALIILNGESGNMIDQDGRSTVMQARGIPSRALAKW